jgi:AcrR family transcriptional regulator
MLTPERKSASNRRHDETETYRAILSVAERLFTTIGYRKTTVADIADELSMSPANVYRFFESKKAINEAVAELVLGDIGDALEKIASSNATAPNRLSEFLETLARLSEERFMTNRRVYDMVEDAMTESWTVCLAYIQRVESLLVCIVESGCEDGDFDVPDPVAAAATVKALMVCFMHPTMMATSYEPGRPAISDAVTFALRGLGARSKH